MRSFIYLAVFSCCLILSGCESVDTWRTYDIYVLGYKIGPDGTKSVSYWKNGVEVPITDGSTPVEVSRIKVSIQDVYIVGTEYPSNTNNGVATYWKNGEPVALTAATANHKANDIEITSMVHVIGLDMNEGIPKHWKNGVETILPHTGWTNPVDILVLNDESACIVGVDTEVDTVRGRFWFNDQIIRIGKKSKHCEFTSVFRIENETYIAGFDNADIKNGEGKVWINGPQLTLGSLAKPGNIIVDKNKDFYVVDLARPGYWKNVLFKEVEKDVDNNSTVGVSIAVQDGDVILGTNKRKLPSGDHVAGYVWVNGIPEAPFNTNNNIEIVDVIVVDHL